LDFSFGTFLNVKGKQGSLILFVPENPASLYGEKKKEKRS
jgi:hypothetical protein